MNDIYWQEKRTMISKPFSSSIPTNLSGCLCEQTKHYQPIDNRLNAKNFQYSTVSNRSYNNISLPYASSAYGVYRRTPLNLKGPPCAYTNLSRRIDLRNRSQLSRKIDDSKYEELNDLVNVIYGNKKKNTDAEDQENCSDIFDYNFANTGVSFK
jgi:hypothetical protein